MANPETALMNSMMLALSQADFMVFRNNCGAWKDPNGRVIRYGVGGKGGSDLLVIGKDGVFCAIEVKTATGRIRPEQLTFIAAVQKAGGRAGVARSTQEALDIARGAV